MNILLEKFWTDNYDIKSSRELKRLIDFYKHCQYNHSGSEYTEMHHMVPVSIIKECMNISNKINLITLSAREHFIAHLILSRVFKDKTSEYYKMNTALFMMCQSNKTQNRHIIGSRMYEKLKIRFGESIANSNHNRSRNTDNIKGEKNPAYGKHWYNNGSENKFLTEDEFNSSFKNSGFVRGMLRSKEHNMKIRDSLKGITFSDDHKKHMSESQKGKTVSIETRIKLSKASRGRKMSDSTKDKMSRIMAGNKYGLGNKSTKGMRAMNNGIINTTVPIDKTQSYLDNGWVFGRLKYKQSKLI